MEEVRICTQCKYPLTCNTLRCPRCNEFVPVGCEHCKSCILTVKRKKDK